MTQTDVSAVQPTTPALPSRPHPALYAGWLTDVGRVREGNEDALFTMTTEFEQGAQRQTIGLFIVADGMGGHEQGEHASALAARTAADELLRRLVGPATRGETGNVPLHEAMRAAVLEAHNRVRRDVPGAGTTLTVALIVDEILAIGHVGDSRAYLCRDGQVEQLTHDHSLVARLVEMGQTTEEEAAVDPRRNYLLRALGQGESLDVDFAFQSFAPGSRLLLCCDGLWGQVSLADITRIMQQSVDPYVACQQLIELANAAGGPDNITAIFVIRQ
ncbi:MAG: protein phosphatase 2C domain-containing protein [Chloroflexota bacterium]